MFVLADYFDQFDDEPLAFKKSTSRVGPKKAPDLAWDCLENRTVFGLRPTFSPLKPVVQEGRQLTVKGPVRARGSPLDDDPRLAELSKKRRNFAFESTLSARSFAPWLQRLKSRGYGGP